MEKELELKIKINRQEANQQSEAFHQEERRRIDQTKQQAIQSNRDVTNQAMEGSRTQQRAAQGVSDAHRMTGQAVGAVRSQLIGLLGTYASLQALPMTLKAISSAWEDVNRRTLEASKSALAFEKDRREYAALIGKPDAASAMGESLKFGLQSRLDSKAADDFQKQFIGSLPSGLQKGNIDQATADLFKVQAGVYAARQGGSASTRGDLAGILPQFMKFSAGEAGVKQGMGALESIRMGLTEGRGDDTPLTQALLHVAGSLVDEEKGMVGTLPELAALVGVTSLSAGPAMADTRSEQLVRALSGSTPDQIERLQSEFGIQGSDKLMDRLGKVIPKLKGMQDKGVNVRDWLITNKLADSEQSRALMEMMPNFGVLQERMARAKDTSAGGEVLEANEKWLGSGAAMDALRATRDEAATYITGKETIDAANLVGMQKSRDKARGMDKMPLMNLGDRMAGWMNWSSGDEQRERRQRYETYQSLMPEANRVGVDLAALNASSYGAVYNAPGVDEIQKLANAIGAKGGDPYAAFGGSGRAGRGIGKEDGEELDVLKQMLDVLKNPSRPPTPLTSAAPEVGRGPAG